MLNFGVEEFSGGISYSSSFSDNSVARWCPPKLRWWKVNFDVVFANGRAAVAFMI